jgi:hypothetical protein
MRLPLQKILTVALSVIIGVLAWKCWSLKGSAVWTGFITFQAEHARERVRLGDNPESTAYGLDFYLIYYRAHIRSVRDRMLIQVVERDRKQTIEEVLAYLRKATGEDLGEDPDRWMAKYCPR